MIDSLKDKACSVDANNGKDIVDVLADVAEAVDGLIDKESQYSVNNKPALLDYMRARIASEALAGMLSNPDWSSNSIAPEANKSNRSSLVELAVNAADALMAELTKTAGNT